MSSSISKKLSLSKLNINTNTDCLTIGEDTLTTLLENNKGKDGEDGKDGKDGKDGEDGKDGKDGGGVKTVSVLYAVDVDYQSITTSSEKIKFSYYYELDNLYISLLDNEIIRFKQNGSYLITAKLQYGCQDIDDQDDPVILHFRLMEYKTDISNAKQHGFSLSTKMYNKTVTPTEISLTLNIGDDDSDNFSAPHCIYFEGIMKENNGTAGLYSPQIIDDWKQSSSASIIINRIT